MSEEPATALVERLFGATIGALELMSVHLGWRLGLYDRLVDAGPGDGLTPGGLAAAAGIDERYAQEWLEQQAVAGLLAVDDVTADAADRRYRVPPAHVGVLVDRRSLDHVAAFAPMVVGIAGALPEVVAAYRSGAGVPYGHYGADFRDGQGAINRPAYEHEMGSWLASMPDIEARLRAGGRAVDLGCGQGWSTIALARSVPGAEVVGIDSDPDSIEDARANAAAETVTVSFEAADAAAIGGPSDLVCIFEALHDMADPVGALQAARHQLGDGGAVLVVDEKVQDAFVAPGDEVERMMYGWSVLHCLPASRAESPSAALGTVLRRTVVEDLARAAGFSSSAVLDIDNDLFRFYRLDP